MKSRLCRRLGRVSTTPSQKRVKRLLLEVLLRSVVPLRRLPQPLLQRPAASLQRKCFPCKQSTPWWIQAGQMTPSLKTSTPFACQMLLISLFVMDWISVSSNQDCMK